MAKTKKNAAAVALGRLGGLRGGKARAASMTAAERSASARKAVVARRARAKKSGKKGWGYVSGHMLYRNEAEHRLSSEAGEQDFIQRRPA